MCLAWLHRRLVAGSQVMTLTVSLQIWVLAAALFFGVLLLETTSPWLNFMLCTLTITYARNAAPWPRPFRGARTSTLHLLATALDTPPCSYMLQWAASIPIPHPPPAASLKDPALEWFVWTGRSRSHCGRSPTWTCPSRRPFIASSSSSSPSRCSPASGPSARAPSASKRSSTPSVAGAHSPYLRTTHLHDRYRPCLLHLPRWQRTRAIGNGKDWQAAHATVETRLQWSPLPQGQSASDTHQPGATRRSCR